MNIFEMFDFIFEMLDCIFEMFTENNIIWKEHSPISRHKNIQTLKKHIAYDLHKK